MHSDGSRRPPLPDPVTLQRQLPDDRVDANRASSSGASPSADTQLAVTAKHTYVGVAPPPDACSDAVAPKPRGAHAATSVGTAAGDGRYRDVGFIGAGGMGEVRRVHDRVLDRKLAMKVLSSELSGNPEARACFYQEARVTGSLQHPGIVAVHDVGELPDGRPFFTMKEVHGRTFSAEIEALHQARADDDGTQGRALRRIVSALVRVSEALAYAHSAGIIHRDIKPQNLMVGRFGEVQVMDWGLAVKRAVDAPRSSASKDSRVAGTLAYMPPEQARGDHDALCFASDMYSLGAVLYTVLTGQLPYAGQANVWSALMNRAPRSLADFAASPLRPAPLCRICDTAMQREPHRRYRDGGEMARALQDWLDDTQRHERAQALVMKADRLWSGEAQQDGIKTMLTNITTLRRRADQLLDNIKPSDPVRKKIPAWKQQDKAAELEHIAAAKEVEWLQVLRSALNEVPDLAAAHTRLADYYRQALDDAEERRAANDIMRAETLLRSHDRGRHSAYLRGDASLTLTTQPAGAEVTLLRYEVVNRRLVAQHLAELGTTPLHNLTLPSGSYLLLIKKRGYHDVRYPVQLARGAIWTGVRPDDTEPAALRLFEQGTLGKDDVYIPGGWFISGGDPHAIESLPRRTLWIDPLVMKRYPITRSEYLTFLNALVDGGRTEDALRHVPKQPLGHSSDGKALPAWPRDASGYYQLPQQWPEQSQRRWPVTRIDWYDACAYAEWLKTRSGQPWRLPCELEWEKAARGVDGRLFPWGDFFDPTFACVLESHEEPLGPRSVEEYPDDESPYGIRGMAGHVRDWCIDRWERIGPRVNGQLLASNAPHNSAEKPNLRCARGGAWTAPGSRGRPASRYADKPDRCWGGLGFRLVRTPADLTAHRKR